MIILTDMERKIIWASRKSDYIDAAKGATWVFDVIDKSGIDPKQARGVISSLIKKGLVNVF